MKPVLFREAGRVSFPSPSKGNPKMLWPGRRIITDRVMSFLLWNAYKFGVQTKIQTLKSTHLYGMDLAFIDQIN